MKKKEELIINALIKKYNDILLQSMRIAIAEDLTNLIIANQDDTNFELIEFIKNKDEFKQYVMAEFFRQNSNSVINELSSMEDPFTPKKRKKSSKK